MRSMSVIIFSAAEIRRRSRAHGLLLQKEFQAQILDLAFLLIDVAVEGP